MNMQMKKVLLSVLAGAALVASTTAGALAAGPGTPEAQSCKGQNTAVLAQIGQGAIHGTSGLRGLTRLSGGLLTVQLVQAEIKTACDNPSAAPAAS
jgi:hypothetical protein